MNVSGRFHLGVTVLTVTTMSLFLSSVVPYLKTLNTPLFVSSSVVALLGSAGFYTFFAKVLAGLLERNRWVKWKVFGPNDIHGTWIGMYQQADGIMIYSVEHITQSLDAISVDGQGFFEDGSPNGEWVSVVAGIDAQQKKLIYVYDCDNVARQGSLDGIGVFKLKRSTPSSRPMILDGYSADLKAESKRHPNMELRIDDEFMDTRQAFQKLLSLSRGPDWCRMPSKKPWWQFLKFWEIV